MSFLLTLEEDRLDLIIPLLAKYDKQLLASEPIFELEGRRIEEIARTLPHYQSSYDQQFQELKALEEWLTIIQDKRMGKLWKKYLEGYSRALGTKDIQMYIGNEKDIVELKQILLEVTLMKSKCLSIVEALKQMGWMLGHVTKLRIAEMQDSIL